MRLPNRVEAWDDERDLEHGIIVTLRPGWSFEYRNHEGVRGFDTVREAKEAIKDAYPCDCEWCGKELADGQD